MTWLRRLDAAWLAPAPAERLAALRVLVGGFCCWYLVFRFGAFVRLGGMDPSGFQPVGVVAVLSAPLKSWAATAVLGATIAAAVAFAAGWRFSVTGPVFAALLLWLTSYRSSWGMIFHSENLLWLHVAVLAVTPAADALSLDARRRSAPAPADARYGWPVRLIAVLAVAAYFLAGVAKLRGSGWSWGAGELLRNHVAFNAVRKAELGGGASGVAGAMLEHAWLFAPMAWASLALELGAPLALAHRWIGRAWAVGMFAFSWGVATIMEISFFYPMTGVAFAAFWPVERLARLPGARYLSAGRARS